MNLWPTSALFLVMLSCGLSDFSPQQATFACNDDGDCASGWRCVNVGAGPVCARSVGDGAVDAGAETDASLDVVDTFAPREVDAADEVDAVAEETSSVLLVDTGVTFASEGDHWVQSGGIGKRYYVAPEAMTRAAAVTYCASRTEGGISWSLARLQELKALSRCCLTRPTEAERCVEAAVGTCYFDAACAPASECRGCGAPPPGDACWWDPTFTADCDAYWALPSGNCGVAFDFRISEIVTVDPGTARRVMCTANPN